MVMVVVVRIEPWNNFAIAARMRDDGARGGGLLVCVDECTGELLTMFTCGDYSGHALCRKLGKFCTLL